MNKTIKCNKQIKAIKDLIHNCINCLMHKFEYLNEKLGENIKEKFKHRWHKNIKNNYIWYIKIK